LGIVTYAENLDHAYEIVLLLWSILFAALFQHMTWLWPKEKWEGVSSFVWAFFLIPLAAGIFLWLYNQTTSNLNQKMYYRTISWFFSLVNMWSYSAVVCVIVNAGIAKNIPELAGFGLLMVLILNVFIVPLLLWQLFDKIMTLYKGESKELDFWAEKGKWTFRKAQKVGYAIVMILALLIIAYISTIRLV
jgi:hypothetical protein